MMPEALEVAEQVRIRPAVAGDVAFIKATWLKSFRATSEAAAQIPGPVYFPEHSGLIDRILARCAPLVACHAEAPDEILGWAAAEVIAGRLVLHYVYEKRLFRGFGVASLLLERLPKGGFYSHKTPVMDGHAKRLGLVFNPYLAGSIL